MISISQPQNFHHLIRTEIQSLDPKSSGPAMLERHVKSLASQEAT